jgi:hypothetical protein
LMILSILHAGHPPVFQHWWVRTSMGCYPHFILPTRRSRGFASTAIHRSAHFGLAMAPRQHRLTKAGNRKSPDHYAKGTPSPLSGLQIEDCRFEKERPTAPHSAIRNLQSAIRLDGLRPLVGMWFQVHYPPLKGVLPIVRSRYLVRYRSPAST